MSRWRSCEFAPELLLLNFDSARFSALSPRRLAPRGNIVQNRLQVGQGGYNAYMVRQPSAHPAGHIGWHLMGLWLRLQEKGVIRGRCWHRPREISRFGISSPVRAFGVSGLQLVRLGEPRSGDAKLLIWASNTYWSATSTGAGSHAELHLNNGNSNSKTDGNNNYVALEVV
jgi:hypothetical protein